MSTESAVTLEDVRTARSRIRQHVKLTSCNLSPELSSPLGCPLQFTMENLQRTGAYKERGAVNAVLTPDEAQRKAGVIAASAGNHAEGLAFAARYDHIPVAPE